MPKGPQGQKRPADAAQCAVHVGRIATKQIEDKLPNQGARAMGLKGGAARAKALTKKERVASAKKAAKAHSESAAKKRKAKLEAEQESEA